MDKEYFKYQHAAILLAAAHRMAVRNHQRCVIKKLVLRNVKLIDISFTAASNDSALRGCIN